MKVSFFRLAAAGLFATGSAQAADLPTRKSAPVEYLRICAAYGPGFFYIPGSDTCIRIGGRAVFEYATGNVFNRGADDVELQCDRPAQPSTRAPRPIGGCCEPSCAWTSAATAATPRWAPSARAAARAARRRSPTPRPAGPFPTFAGADTAGNRLQTGVVIGAAYRAMGRADGRAPAILLRLLHGQRHLVRHRRFGRPHPGAWPTPTPSETASRRPCRSRIRRSARDTRSPASRRSELGGINPTRGRRAPFTDHLSFRLQPFRRAGDRGHPGLRRNGLDQLHPA